MKIKALKKTVLKKTTEDSSELAEDQLHEVPKGREYTVNKSAPADGDHLEVDLAYKAGKWFIFKPHWEFISEDGKELDDEFTQVFTKTSLREILPLASSADIATYVEPLNRVCEKFDIVTSKRAAAFIAQLAHESGSLRYKEEIASGAAYEGRKDLGNTQPGDGVRYKGRGLIQLTGRANYRMAGKALGLPLEEQPEIVVKDPYTNALVAGWYWDRHNLNAYADREDFLSITKRINGGTNGLADRQQYWERAKKVLYNRANLNEVDWSNPSAKVSKYFTVREVTLGRKNRIPTDPKIRERIILLARELDKVREAWGGPLLVTSWYRPPAVNRAVGGVKDSRHLFGDAADIRPADISRLREFQDWVDRQWFGALGKGADKGFVHLDMRNGKGFQGKGAKGVRWDY